LWLQRTRRRRWLRAFRLLPDGARALTLIESEAPGDPCKLGRLALVAGNSGPLSLVRTKGLRVIDVVAMHSGEAISALRFGPGGASFLVGTYQGRLYHFELKPHPLWAYW
jgi:hypothetical protein